MENENTNIIFIDKLWDGPGGKFEDTVSKVIDTDEFQISGFKLTGDEENVSEITNAVRNSDGRCIVMLSAEIWDQSKDFDTLSKVGTTLVNEKDTDMFLVIHTDVTNYSGMALYELFKECISDHNLKHIELTKPYPITFYGESNNFDYLYNHNLKGKFRNFIKRIEEKNNNGQPEAN